jgi:Icc-related predicted phosphoesterase
MSGFAYVNTPDLDIVFFSEAHLGNFIEQAEAACAAADLVVALGNLDLVALARLLPARKPALCVLGGQDAEAAPPAPFRALHGGGVTFKDWRVAGLSGARRLGPGQGFFIDEEEARELLSDMPSCDLLLSHAPPAGLPLRGRRGIETGLLALAEYISEHEPIYAFYAHDGDDHVDDELGQPGGSTWVVGVSGMLHPAPLRFV